MEPEPVCRFLDWDTEFFGRRIASVAGNHLDPERWKRAEAWCREHAIEGLYFLGDTTDLVTIRTAEDARFRLVDLRVTLACNLARTALPATGTGDEEIREGTEADIPALREIAGVSHTDSRFFSDPEFTRESCARLYEIWIEKSCRGWAERVWVAVREGRAVGYLSCHLDEGVRGHIGLVGVAPESRGRGIATRLVRRGLSWFSEQGRTQIEVATQGRNAGAQSHYQASGFRTKNLQLWYHLWFARGNAPRT